MPFFEDVDAIGIVERHIDKVLKLEESEAKNLLRRYRTIRQRLRDRLDTFSDDQFTAQQLRGVLVQVEAAIQAMREELKTGMSEAAKRSALEGVRDLVAEIEEFSKKFEGAVIPIRLPESVISADTSDFLFNRYQASIEAYSEDLRQLMARELTDLSIMERPFSEMVQKVSRFFIGEEWKINRIARTELHNVYNIGKLNGMRESKDQIPDLQKGLIHPLDHRTGEDSVQAAKEDLVAEIDKPFKFTWKGETRVFMAPPDRPNDRAILVPYRESWDQ